MIEGNGPIDKSINPKRGAQFMVASSTTFAVILIAGQSVRAVGTDAERGNDVSLAAFEFGEAEGRVGESVDDLTELGLVLIHIKYYEMSQLFQE